MRIIRQMTEAEMRLIRRVDQDPSGRMSLDGTAAQTSGHIPTKTKT